MMMSLSVNKFTYVGDNDFNLNFALGIASRSDVKCYIAGTQQVAVSFNWLTDNSVRIIPTDVNVGDTLVFERTVSKTTLPVDLSQPSAMTRESIKTTMLNSMYAVHEVLDGRYSGELEDTAATMVNLSKAWAESPSAPGDPGTKSSKTWAGEAEADRIQTAEDRVQTGLDRVATGQDRVQTGADRVATGEDKAATAADRVQTGLDVKATNANVAAITGLSATANTLAPNAPATASYNSGTGVLTLGVPKGDPGVGLETVPEGRIVGRNSAGTGEAEYLTAPQARAVIGFYRSVSDVETATIPASLYTIRTEGFYEGGDGGDATYKRVATEPAHAGKVQSADGTWWERVANSGPSDLTAARVAIDRSKNVLAPLDVAVNWDENSPPDITAAVRACLDDYGSCVIPRGIYEISDRIDLKSRRLSGVHNHGTVLRGTAAIDEFNPIIRTGRSSYVNDIRLEYAPSVTVTNTAGSRVLIDTTGQTDSYPMQRPSEIANVIFGRCGTSLCDRGEDNFSVGYRNLEFLDYARAAVDFWGAYQTGNVWSNIYVGKSSFSPQWGVSMGGHRAGDVFHQLNIEHTQFVQAALNLERQESVYISALHLEGTDLSTDYQGLVRLVNSNLRVDSVSTYFTRRSTSGQAIFYLGDSGNYDGASIESVGYGQGNLRVGALTCWGIGTPNTSLYPGQNVGLGANFYFFYRPAAATGNVLVDLDIYDYRSYSTDATENNRYKAMQSDPHSKIQWVKKRAIPSSAPTATLPMDRIVNGQTILDSTTGRLNVWNGSQWWEV